MRIFRLGAVTAAAMILAGCEMHTFDLIELRDTEVAGGTEFTQALQKEYLALANFEADVEYDWVDADKWAERDCWPPRARRPSRNARRTGSAARRTWTRRGSA